jgi:hypothetical protein
MSIASDDAIVIGSGPGGGTWCSRSPASASEPCCWNAADISSGIRQTGTPGKSSNARIQAKEVWNSSGGKRSSPGLHYYVGVKFYGPCCFLTFGVEGLKQRRDRAAGARQ